MAAYTEKYHVQHMRVAQLSSGAKPESRVSGFFAAAKPSGLFVISVDERRAAAKSLAFSVITSLQKKWTA
jgi:hypothetical protein